jgi:hypothetical protein
VINCSKSSIGRDKREERRQKRESGSFSSFFFLPSSFLSPVSNSADRERPERVHDQNAFPDYIPEAKFTQVSQRIGISAIRGHAWEAPRFRKAKEFSNAINFFDRICGIA